MGRWLNRDPIGIKGGINVYGFVGNDGINDWDLLGLAKKTIAFLLGGSDSLLNSAKTDIENNLKKKIEKSKDYCYYLKMNATKEDFEEWVYTKEDVAGVIVIAHGGISEGLDKKQKKKLREYAKTLQKGISSWKEEFFIDKLKKLKTMQEEYLKLMESVKKGKSYMRLNTDAYRIDSNKTIKNTTFQLSCWNKWVYTGTQPDKLFLMTPTLATDRLKKAIKNPDKFYEPETDDSIAQYRYNNHVRYTFGGGGLFPINIRAIGYLLSSVEKKFNLTSEKK